MATQTKTGLHPLLQQIVDALPSEFQEVVLRIRKNDRYHRRDHLNLSYFGYATVIEYDRVEGVMLHPRFGYRRSRRYPIRKDGTINVKKIVEVASEVFNVHHERKKAEEAEDQRRMEARAERARLDALLFERLDGGASIEVIPADDSFGVRLKRRGAKNIDGGVRPLSEDAVRATIPFEGSVERLNEILKFMGEQS